MIDRRTKNVEIFRDTEWRYKTDGQLVKAVRASTEKQVFIAENEAITVPTPNKTEKAQVIVSGNSRHSSWTSHTTCDIVVYQRRCTT